MENSVLFASNAMTTTFAFLVFICSLLLISRRMLKRVAKKQAAPEAAGAWPLIGHFHLLGGPEPPHIVLSKMADKYGPIFTVRLGASRALVVSNSELAKECLTTNDKAFANRPNFVATDLLCFDRTIFAFSPYDTYWRHTKKIATLELLSNQRLEMLKHVRESEVATAVKELFKFWENNRSGSNTALVEMRRWFFDLTLNVISRLVVGKSAGYITAQHGDDRNGNWKKALREFFDLMGRFVAADALPFLRWFDIGGYESAMKRTAKELELVTEEWLKEHKFKKVSGVEKSKEDFMDLMLDIIDDNVQQVLGRDSDTIIKSTCLTLILGASDTSAVTLIWALALLINNPHVLKKAQQELDIHVGRERQLRESDVNKLVYLKAIIKETLRLYPAGPLSVPHESLEDCTVYGQYHIPKSTILLINLWKIHRDPGVWSNPFQFQPERFLTTHKDFDVKGQHFEYIPFSSGRRMCPGVSSAMQVLQLTLGSLLHGFDFASPTGEAVDMTESIGLTNLRATPLRLLINPRLQSSLYQ